MLKDKFKRLKIDKGRAATCDTFEIFLLQFTSGEARIVPVFSGRASRVSETPKELALQSGQRYPRRSPNLRPWENESSRGFQTVTLRANIYRRVMVWCF